MPLAWERHSLPELGGGALQPPVDQWAELEEPQPPALVRHYDSSYWGNLALAGAVGKSREACSEPASVLYLQEAWGDGQNPALEPAAWT